MTLSAPGIARIPQRAVTAAGLDFSPDVPGQRRDAQDLLDTTMQIIRV